MIDPWMSSLKTEAIYVEDETLETTHEPVEDVVMGEGFPMKAVQVATHDYPCNCGVC